MVPEPPSCPHCRRPLSKWRPPEQSTWSGEHQYVCFNDDCAYFVRGWRWMREQFNVAASYRHRFDPVTGEQGPLPVWSPEALRNDLITDQG